MSSALSSSASAASPVTWSEWDAVLFDLDGVVTPTAEVHMRAWGEMFNEFLASPEAAEIDGGPGALAPYTDDDYFAHVDGKPRYDGVRDFLASRGISLPEGSDSDGAEALSVRGLGNRKNEVFNAVLDRDGVEPYPGSVALLDHLRDLEIPLAIVSSSRNASSVLNAAGLSGRFVTVVSGAVATDLRLPGKPAPDTFVHAAMVLNASVERSVVLEDAVSGVRAGAAGGFGLVVGVDRGVGAETLAEVGAHLVVNDLAELVPGEQEVQA